MNWRIRGLIGAVTLLALLLCGCASFKKEASAEAKGKSYFTYFDTVTYVFSYAGDSTERFDDRSAEVSAIFEKYHKLFDIYHEYTGISNLCTLNRNAGGEPVKVEPELIDFLDLAAELYELTGGEMNIMMGAVLSLWHDCRTQAQDDPAKARIPSEDELRAAAEHIDPSLLEIDRENSTVRISDPAASIDVGALGKGYAAEKAAQFLLADGADGYVINAGGNIRIIGNKPDGSDWVTGIRNPKEPDQLAATIHLADTSCVTSGTYERFFTVNGVKYHHIIDADTLMPSSHFSSVTVITPDSALADCLSTALFCMSYEDGLELVETIGNVEVIWICPDGDIIYTPGAADLIISE